MSGRRADLAAAVGRRRFVQAGAAAGAGLLLAPDTALARAGRLGRARNLVFLVSDGASTGTITLADAALRLDGGAGSWWCRLWSMPGARRAAMSTGAADSLVTDSAAASSAWGIGRKVRNGVVNIPEDGTAPPPIMVRAKAAGMRCGLVSTTRITDATPAGFVANVPRRSMEDEVGRQYLERGVDLLLGGGARHFTAADLDAAGALVVRTAAELRTAASAPAPGPFVGLFADGTMAFELDRGDMQPSLAEMTRVALARLAASADAGERGFILQVEGGRVDHAAHGNDAASLLHDQLAFDAALGEALAFARARDDTLLIVCTDHGNANPGLTVYGPQGEAGLRRLRAARRSFEWILQRLGGLRDPGESIEELPAAVRDATGIALHEEEIAWVRRRLADRSPVNGFGEADSAESALGAVLANHYGVAFLSVNHTSDLVEVAAIGPGADALPPLIDNTELCGVMGEALGVG